MTEKSEKIKEIVCSLLEVEPSEITNETTNNDLGMDSLDKIELVMELEREFVISIPDERMSDLTCFLDYVNIVEELTNHE